MSSWVRAEVAWRAVGDTVVVLPPDSDEPLLLTDAAARAWRELEPGSSRRTAGPGTAVERARRELQRLGLVHGPE